MGKLSRHLGIALLGLLVMAGLVFLPAKTVKADGELENGWCRFDPDDGTLYLKKNNETVQKKQYQSIGGTYVIAIELPGDYKPSDVWKVKVEEGDGKFIFPKDSSHLFYSFVNCSEFELNDVDTSSVTNMGGMFENCTEVRNLDVSSFDTSNVTNMKSLFEQCSVLKSVSFGSKFITASVTDMSFMFNNCYNLESLDLSTFTITTNTKVDYMFYDCNELEVIYTLTSWPTPKSCNDVFKGNYKLKGGQGTTTNQGSTFSNAGYLRIDGGADAPGYFTLKGTTPYMVPYMRVEARDNDFAMYFYLSLGRVYNPDSDSNELEKYTVKYKDEIYKWDGRTEDPVNYLRLSDDGRYLYFRVNRKPNDIAVKDNFKITYTPAYEDMVTLYDQDVSLEQYLKTVYNNSDYAALKPVVGNMIRYCSAAQHYYDNVSLDQVACKGLTGYELTDLNAVNLPDASDYSSGTDIKEYFPYTEITYWGSTTTFDKKISLILAFHFGGENDTYEKRIEEYINAHITDSVKVTYKYDTTDKYYLAVFTVPIKELDKVLLTFGNTKMSIVKYLSKSAEMNASDTAYVYLAKAMYQYHLAAKTIN